MNGEIKIDSAYIPHLKNELVVARNDSSDVVSTITINGSEFKKAFKDTKIIALAAVMSGKGGESFLKTLTMLQTNFYDVVDNLISSDASEYIVVTKGQGVIEALNLYIRNPSNVDIKKYSLGEIDKLKTQLQLLDELFNNLLEAIGCVIKSVNETSDIIKKEGLTITKSHTNWQRIENITKSINNILDSPKMQIAGALLLLSGGSYKCAVIGITVANKISEVLSNFANLQEKVLAEAVIGIDALEKGTRHLRDYVATSKNAHVMVNKLANQLQSDLNGLSSNTENTLIISLQVKQLASYIDSLAVPSLQKINNALQPQAIHI